MTEVKYEHPIIEILELRAGFDDVEFKAVMDKFRELYPGMFKHWIIDNIYAEVQSECNRNEDCSVLQWS